MIRKITAILPIFILNGCGWGDAIHDANAGKEQYKACILNHIKSHSTSSSDSKLTKEKATERAISACKKQEDAYVVVMADLAMTITGNIAPREKFLSDQEAKLRDDLREIAASLVEQEL